MARRALSAMRIIRTLRELEVQFAKGQTVPGACANLGITESTFKRWHKVSREVNVAQAKRLEALERENAQLKRLVADARLEAAVLHEAGPGYL